MATVQEEIATRRVPIVRDASFTRACADSAVVMDLGRDIEIAFLQSSPAVTERLRRGEDDNSEEGYEIEPVLAEVSRVRISPAASIFMAMVLIEKAIKADRVHNDALLESIKDLIEQIESDRAKDSSREQE